jgi:hypothetical protein
MFCEQLEIANHLFFQCSTTKVVWGVVAICFNSNTIPIDIHHYKQCIHNVFPQGKPFHHFGFAAICWAMWKCRNRAVFDKKKVIKHPTEIVLHACALLSYWAGLFTPEVRKVVVAGVNPMLAIAHKLLAQQNRAQAVARLTAARGDQSDEEDKI